MRCDTWWCCRASHSPHAETSVPVLTNGEEAVAVDGPAIIVEHEHAQVRTADVYCLLFYVI